MDNTGQSSGGDSQKPSEPKPRADRHRLFWMGWRLGEAGAAERSPWP